MGLKVVQLLFELFLQIFIIKKSETGKQIYSDEKLLKSHKTFSIRTTWC